VLCGEKDIYRSRLKTAGLSGRINTAFISPERANKQKGIDAGLQQDVGRLFIENRLEKRQIQLSSINIALTPYGQPDTETARIAY